MPGRQIAANESWMLVDGHVHVHPQFDSARFLDAAAGNLRAMASQLGAGKVWSGFLLLAEMCGVDWFGSTCNRLSGGDTAIGNWQFSFSHEPETLMAKDRHRSDTLFIVAGRQVVTSEKIEVLALMTRQMVADGMSLDLTVGACHAAGALVVLPWGVGKWLGSRGRLIERTLTIHAGDGPVLAGDNGGRPWFWPRPRIFTRLESAGLPVLPGTDPLPLSDQVSRVGSYGMALVGAISGDAPTANLKARLLAGWDEARMRPFGRLESALGFVRNQVRLRA